MKILILILVIFTLISINLVVLIYPMPDFVEHIFNFDFIHYINSILAD